MKTCGNIDGKPCEFFNRLPENNGCRRATSGDTACAPMLALVDARDESAKLTAIISMVVAEMEGMPTGYDDDAREDDPSPEDMVAHVAGLVRRRCLRALGEEE